MADLAVGGVAAKSGVSVRTLHYYDEIGLLPPSGRTEAGYRLYSPGDVRRLEHIVLLRSLGMRLDDIAAALTADVSELRDLLGRQASEMRQRLAGQQALLARLEHMAERAAADSVRSIDDAFETMRALEVFERHFDEEQLASLREDARRLGPETIAEVEREWPKLIAAVRYEMAAGTPPGDPRVRPLIERWQELVDLFVNGRFDRAAAAGRMMHAEPAVRQRTGLDANVMTYVATATAAARTRAL